jgi:diguanylate cyclase (GGDEF)-like protein/PAS domain S-box-containing protein
MFQEQAQFNVEPIPLKSKKRDVKRYQLAFEGTQDGIWDWDLITQTLYFSASWQRSPEHSNQDARQDLETWFERIHPEDLYWVKHEIEACLDGYKTQLEIEYRMLHPDGDYRWVLSRGSVSRNEKNKPVRMIGLQIDVTRLKQSELTFSHEALYDSLTGLPNRTALMERLSRSADLAAHEPEFLFAVLFIDLDRFKMINDSLGHQIGDQLLSEIASRLTNCLRPTDTIARLGSDEFAILLEDVKTQEIAVALVQRILSAVSAPYTIADYDIFTSASIGITFSTSGFTHPENLLRDADLAMYRAKTQGRGCYEIFHPRMYSSAVAELELETDLRRAVERQEFELHYQPIVSLRTHRVVGFEALIRWQHPQQGFISPAKFIPIAEETGLIQPIGDWILREACTQMRQWQTRFPDWPPLTMNINLSSRQFTPQLVDQLRQVLQATNLGGEFLKLEITESMLMSHAESAISTLTQLKQLGVQIAIDDFGTGYSSLSYLHRFPIDTLKVDRSFVQRLDTDGEQLAIVRTIITLAWNLGMEVVAEGVETSKQLVQLRSLQCEYAQGYLFSRPRDVHAVETLMIEELDQWRFDPFNQKKS